MWDLALELRVVEVTEGGRAAQQQLVGPRPEGQPGTLEPAHRGDVLRGGRATVGRDLARLPQRFSLFAVDPLHLLEEVIDQRELGIRVLRHLLGTLALDPVERDPDVGDLLRDDLDDHAAAVGGVGDTPHIAGLLEAIDDARDRAGREPGDLRQLAGGRRAHVDELLERLDVGLRQAEADRDGLAEERPLDVHPPQRPEDGIDVLSIHG
jgi:hypothetical protein